MSAHYLTVSEVSEYLKLPEETVYKYARTGRIPASKVGRYWRFEQGKIDHWVEEHSNQDPEPKRVVVVDDDPSIRNILSKWLRETGCHVQAFPGGAEVIASLQTEECDLLFLDLMMPAPNGVETLQAVRQIKPSLDVVIVTAYFDSRMMDEALEMGPLTVLKKPVEKEALQKVVQSLTTKKS